MDLRQRSVTMTITVNSSGTAVADGATTMMTLTVTFTSSEATTNFASMDITVSGGDQQFTAKQHSYTATFTPSAMEQLPSM